VAQTGKESKSKSKSKSKSNKSRRLVRDLLAVASLHAHQQSQSQSQPQSQSRSQSQSNSPTESRVEPTLSGQVHTALPTANEGPGLDRPPSLTHRRHFGCTSTHFICAPSRSLPGRPGGPLPCATHSLVVVALVGDAVALKCGAMAFCIRVNMPVQSISGHVHVRARALALSSTT
jgi:hypothetical protein